jgi:hypothetical protein
LLGRSVLQACVQVLSAQSIRVMPLKGLWLQEFVYGADAERSTTDVDVLVEPGCYEPARRLLARASWQLSGQDVSESTYVPPGLPLPLDLHARLYTPGAFRMPPSELFARGRPDEAVFGVPVVLPDPLDVLSHLVGHALKSGSAYRGDGQELRDIPRLASACDIDPRACAQHLQRCGLGRAARFVLPLTAADEPRRFASEVLAQLPEDRPGRALAQGARYLRTRFGSLPLMATITGFALDVSLPRGFGTASLRAADRARGALRLRGGRRFMTG